MRDLDELRRPQADGYVCTICCEAADEIERLRAALERIKTDEWAAGYVDLGGDIAWGMLIEYVDKVLAAQHSETEERSQGNG